MEERKMNRARRNEDDYGTRYPSSATPKRAVNITRTSGGEAMWEKSQKGDRAANLGILMLGRIQQ